ncbi:MAG: signal peptidase I [Acidimicrobiia bacterium]
MSGTETTPKAEKPRSFILELPGLLLGALIIAVLLKTFVVQPFYIPSESMLETLQVNDRVMVSKLTYRFGEIERGDVIVFETGPEVEMSVAENVVKAVLDALGIRSSGQEDLIKRVIALGGDRVEIRDNEVIVNDSPIYEPYISDAGMADMAVQTIPAGMIWVMGDHRCGGCSQDSRFIGPIPVEDVIGKAVVRIWPYDRVGGL